jgi:hypothetical protein
MGARFKQAARVPPGVTPEQVLAELADIEARFGRRSVDDAVKVVLSEPDRYPALRAFGPPDAETAFLQAVRESILYAVRIIVQDADPGEPECRVLHIVHDPGDGQAVWADLSTIAQSEPYQAELVRALRRDAEAFSHKLTTTLAELAAILGA